MSFRGIIVTRTRLLCLDDDRHLMKLGGWFVWNVFQRILLPLRNDTGSFPTNEIGGGYVFMEVHTGDGGGAERHGVVPGHPRHLYAFR